MVNHLQLDKNYHLRRIKVKIDLVTILNAFLSTEKKQTHTHASAVCACHSFHTSMQRFRVVNESRMWDQTFGRRREWIFNYLTR